ncbi:hypothetical protein ES288_D03G195500v1 [Gossypium darwinii]|uniref:Maspardin n=2 Tax=Gossypium darwinii TaxID=34276 RepID=A0A5D2D6D3_GOSDA|nr:hypothetical protein ES288_D03G195500v1 [Gossypium darwinii]
MKGVYSAPGDYIHFKSQVPLHKIPIGTKQWRYYDFGPKVVPPLICLPGTAGTADVYYKQIMSLSMKGYRVISVDIPCVWNHQEWIQSFEKFLDAIDVHHPFSAAMRWAPIVGWAPSFLLKRYILTGIHDGPQEPFIADSVDFVVSQVETLSRDDLASRLAFTVDNASVGPLLLSDSLITIMDTNDYSSIPQELKDQLGERYPAARRAYLKTGGDFPFLSCPDEVNLHLQLHLRRVGVEAKPDLVRTIPKDGSGGSPGKENDEKKDHDDQPNGHGGNPESTSKESQSPPSPESSEYHGLYDQLLSSAKVISIGREDSTLMKDQLILATGVLLQLTWEFFIFSLLPIYVCSLYITENNVWKFRKLV